VPYSLSNKAFGHERLAEICTEMAELQARNHQLALARTQSHVVDTLKSTVYPILTLPPEITAEIFIYCVADVPLSLPRLRGLEVPLLASARRAWRQIALNLTYGQPSRCTRTQRMPSCNLTRAENHLLALQYQPSRYFHFRPR
jgi:hypothetical protein